MKDIDKQILKALNSFISSNKDSVKVKYNGSIEITHKNMNLIVTIEPEMDRVIFEPNSYKDSINFQRTPVSYGMFSKEYRTLRKLINELKDEEDLSYKQSLLQVFR